MLGARFAKSPGSACLLSARKQVSIVYILTQGRNRPVLGTWTMKFHVGSQLTQPGRTGRPANDPGIQCWFPILPCTNNSRQRTFPETCWKGVWGGWLRLSWFFIPRYLQLYNLWFTFLACCSVSPAGLTSPKGSGTPMGSQLHGP